MELVEVIVTVPPLTTSVPKSFSELVSARVPGPAINNDPLVTRAEITRSFAAGPSRMVNVRMPLPRSSTPGAWPEKSVPVAMAAAPAVELAMDTFPSSINLPGVAASGDRVSVVEIICRPLLRDDSRSSRKD